jgi:hypothetical protein
METSKKTAGKITEFGKRVIKVLEDNDLMKSDGTVNYTEAERLSQLGGSILSKAVKRKGMGKDNFRKFHSTFHVNPLWLKAGKGEPYIKNGTPVGEPAIKNPESSESRILERIDRLIDNVNSFGEFNQFLIGEVNRLRQKIKDLGGEI